MDKISLKAPAKINLYLRVLGRREDGYHEIDTLVQAIDLYDDITIEKSDIIELTCDDPSLPDNQDNLIFNAASVLQSRFYFPGAKIDLKKRIPVGSGLGGGSSDAAFVLRGLCRLYGLEPDPDEIIEIAASIGSDVPFFLSGGQAQVSGRGERIRMVHLPTNYRIALIVPPVTSSTAETYRDMKIDLTANRKPALLSKKIDSSRFYRLLRQSSNDLEKVVFYKQPDLTELKNLLSEAGAVHGSMTGSGSAFFGVFAAESYPKLGIERRLGSGFKVFHCKPILLPPF